MRNWFLGLIGHKKPEHTAIGDSVVRKWDIEPCALPTILMTDDLKRKLEKGVQVNERVYQWFLFSYSHGCRVFPTPEAAKEFTKTQPPGKWHLFTETSHVCTEAVFKEDC